MASNYQQQLSPDYLNALYSHGGIGPDGTYYYGMYDGSGTGDSPGNLTGLYAASPDLVNSNKQNIGAPMPIYDPKTGQITGYRPYTPDPTMSTAMGVLGVLGAVGGGALLGAGAGAGAAGEAGGGELATGGFLGEAPFSATGGGALDFGATGAGAGAGGAGAGGLGGGGGSALASTPAATGGGLSSLLNGVGGSSLLGPAATLLGGLLGSKPTTTSTSSTKNLPGYLQPSVDGLLAQTDALRNAQMQPGALQGYTDMQNAGRSLLANPIAGNGVGKVAYPTQFGFKR